MARSNPLRVTCGALLFALLVLTADAHCAMVEPRFRGTLATFSLSIPKLIERPIADCAHCLNAGGKGGVTLAAGPAGWRPWEPLSPKNFRHDAGLCGDAIRDKAPREHEVGGTFGPPDAMPYSGVYREGGVVEFVADMTTNHQGFFEFFICDVTKCRGDISEACFKQGHCQQLMRVKTPVCESQQSRECGPVDPKYPGRWYVPCRKGGHVGEHFMGGKFMKYRLPRGFKSRHAVIQWYWATANSCNPPGFIDYFERFKMPGWDECPGDGGTIGGRNPKLSDCGGPTFPEEFWSCADVQVTFDGKATERFRVPDKFHKPLPPREEATERDDQKRDERLRDEVLGEMRNEDKKENGMKKDEEMKNPDDGMQNDGKSNQRPVESNRCENCCERQFSEPNEAKPDPKNARCASNWKQCGGKFHHGPKTCCDRRYRCVAINKYFSQCKAPPKVMKKMYKKKKHSKALPRARKTHNGKKTKYARASWQRKRKYQEKDSKRRWR